MVLDEVASIDKRSDRVPREDGPAISRHLTSLPSLSPTELQRLS